MFSSHGLYLVLMRMRKWFILSMEASTSGLELFVSTDQEEKYSFSLYLWIFSWRLFYFDDLYILLKDYRMKSPHFKDNGIFFSLIVKEWDIVSFKSVKEWYCPPSKGVAEVIIGETHFKLKLKEIMGRRGIEPIFKYCVKWIFLHYYLTWFNTL